MAGGRTGHDGGEELMRRPIAEAHGDEEGRVNSASVLLLHRNEVVSLGVAW